MFAEDRTYHYDFNAACDADSWAGWLHPDDGERDNLASDDYPQTSKITRPPPHHD